jgi:hypothetical protein
MAIIALYKTNVFVGSILASLDDDNKEYTYERWRLFNPKEEL